MAINKPTIVAGPTITRGRVQTVVGKITPAIPPAYRKYVDDSGSAALEAQFPEREGQMLFYRDGSNSFVDMYVVVDINGVLTWKRCISTAFMQNGANGQRWDPLAGFYDPLVS